MDPNVDGDGDGFTPAEGDCDDCDPTVNPGAIEVATPPGGMPVDEDCDGKVDNVAPPCDMNLALDDVNAADGAKAIDLCATATMNDKHWGVISALYTRANGNMFMPGVQVGLMDAFGPNVHVQNGSAMLALSSGASRAPNQPGACGSQTCMNNAGGMPPAGFPQAVPGCTLSPTINDDVALDLSIRAPANATGYSFDFRFFTFEFPAWVCTQFADQFVAIVNPAPAGAVSGNVSFDAMMLPMSANVSLVDCCDPVGAPLFAKNCAMPNMCPKAPNPYCPNGVNALQGTGFDIWASANESGATSWLTTVVPVKGGDVFDIRFTIWNGGDQALYSTVLVDDFAWITAAPPALTTTAKMNPK